VSKFGRTPNWTEPQIRPPSVPFCLVSGEFILRIFPGVSGDSRLSPDLSRGTVNLIGGELDVDDPRLRTIRTPQSLHHCFVGYHPCHMNDLSMKAYPCKHNQEHKQE
jgi:hypothetical protein